MRFCFIPKKMFVNEEKEQKRGKKQTKLWIVISVLAVIILVFVIAFRTSHRVPSTLGFEGVGEVSLSASTKAERVEFFAQLGYEVQEAESEEITIPCTDGEFAEYNELQKSQGFDLSAFCGRKATMYSMKILGGNQDTPQLYGVIIVFEGKVVAGHITDNLYPACVKPLASR